VKRFGLIGAAGYIAPRHMRAIRENGCDLVAAVDPFDSVGIIDSFFPNAAFFTEIERFDRFIDKNRNTDKNIEYISICSPNYLHDAHIRLALRSGCDVICEKPLVIMSKNLKYLRNLEAETGRSISCILQLRHHPTILQIRDDFKDVDKKVDIELTYITSRGKWYDYSWKGDESKSGGLAANIGIHFFDMLIWIFGDVEKSIVTSKSLNDISGELSLARANVRWRLSVDSKNLPNHILSSGERAYRNIVINGKSIEFSGGFEDLHTIAYSEALNGNGFGIDDAEPSIKVVENIMSWSEE
jgi:UDP-N-acetyl-2-amino-2-deoxyglucuronate dehydrogenase